MTTDGTGQGAAQLSVMAMDAACQADPQQTGRRIAELAAKLISCAAADIVHHGARGVLHCIASSDQVISDHLGTALQHWPHDPYPETLSDHAALRVEHPVGYLEQVRASTAVVAELTFPLRVGPADHGFLRFLLHEPVAPNTAEGLLGGAFAAHAAIVLDRAALQSTVGNLLTAIDSNREIGAAVGILMARGGISYEDGYQLLKSTSQNNNRKMRDVVDAVLYTGALPSYRDQHGAAVAR